MNQLDLEMENFVAFFPTIVQDIVTNLEDDLSKLKNYMEELLLYVVPNGKKIRGLLVTVSYKIFEKQEKLTSKKLNLAYIMGWIVEIGHAAELLFDDIMDKSEIRRGLPCWYTRKDIGLNGINDGLLLEQALYYLIKKYFSDHDHVLSIYQLFHYMIYKTTNGQALDCMFVKNGKPDLNMFSIENYNTLVKYKNGHFTFCVPVSVAMYLADIVDQELHDEARSILLDIGGLFQMQNDFFDCFGSVQETGNRGIDIRGGKCTWLAVKALEKANSDQRTIIEEHYGSKEQGNVEKICNLYEELGLVAIYTEQEKISFDRIQSRIKKVSVKLPHQLFATILEKVYKRKF